MCDCAAVFGSARWFPPSDKLTACGRNVSGVYPVGAVGVSHWTQVNSNKDPMCEAVARVVDPLTGKSVLVAIVDKCLGCKEEDINLSQGAFKQLRPLEEGSFVVSWEFIK